ncbi:MAG: histidinol-phosphate transaminase [Actinobacteria bacterium]|nr:histidinol-phosphate transaminase [Actinomycetota bacterium]MBM3712116.1 histidinol-phosphate transaminase [Actinomycetota bacterium]
MKIKLKPWIQDLPEYVAGRTIEEIKKAYNLPDVYKLASNENIFGPCDNVKEFIRNNIDDINYYPDSEYRVLKKALASKFNITSQNIIIGSGTDQIIEIICDGYISRGDGIVIADPNFLIYEKAALKCGGSAIKVPLKEFRQDVGGIVSAVNSNTKIVFIANPHNPTGTNIKEEEFKYLINKLADDILIVLDEAYFEYLSPEERINTMGYLVKKENIISLRTFSKVYGLAGLRIGYGIAYKGIISGLEKIRLPFNVSSIAHNAAVVALENDWYIEKIRDIVLKEKEKFYSILKKEGVSYVQSHANFILINCGDFGTEIVEDLLKNGFIVRPGENLGIKGFLRVTISTPEINDKFLSLFIKIYKKYIE